jgi:hypothetical protein
MLRGIKRAKRGIPQGSSIGAAFCAQAENDAGEFHARRVGGEKIVSAA